MAGIKERLYLFCSDYIKNKEDEIKRIIEEARDAANNETKSSAGDKYETGREVMQQEIDLNLTRLNEINKLKDTLHRIVPGQTNDSVQPGALVYTDNGNYYINISAGKATIESNTYYIISIGSPVGMQLAGKKAGDEFDLNGQRIRIKNIN